MCASVHGRAWCARKPGCAWYDDFGPRSYKSRELVSLRRREREGAHGDAWAGVGSEEQEQEVMVWRAGVESEGWEQEVPACSVRDMPVRALGTVGGCRERGTGARGDGAQRARSTSLCAGYEGRASGARDGSKGREQGTGARVVGARRARYAGPHTRYGGRALGARVGNKGRKQEVMARGVRDPPVRVLSTEGRRWARESGVRDGSEVAGQELRRVASAFRQSMRWEWRAALLASGARVGSEGTGVGRGTEAGRGTKAGVGNKSEKTKSRTTSVVPGLKTAGSTGSVLFSLLPVSPALPTIPAVATHPLLTNMEP
ncbi:hypothetical protein K488DRAFT_74491, partial [Vararia minispora EC-137]